MRLTFRLSPPAQRTCSPAGRRQAGGVPRRAGCGRRSAPGRRDRAGAGCRRSSSVSGATTTGPAADERTPPRGPAGRTRRPPCSWSSSAAPAGPVSS